MILGDQLNELRINMLRDVSALEAGDDDRMWSDETLLRYIEDGERRFARETMCLRDSTTPKFTRLTLREGVKNYPLEDAVFAVVSARSAGLDYDLARTGHALIQDRQVDTSAVWDPSELTSIPPGPTRGFYTDETIVFAHGHRVTLSVYPAPDAATAGKKLELRVVRVPCGGYTLKDLKRDSEIPQDYQFDVLEWAAYRCKRNNDSDIGATPNADSHKAAFEEAIARCKRDMRRRMHVPGNVRYGRNGFVWGR